jgi:DNA adenine methylase
VSRLSKRPDHEIRPILKWAGGKRQLLPTLRAHYPSTFSRYFEPFLGSGAVFLDLLSNDLLGKRHAFLSDRNADLIGCYRMIRDEPDEVISHLEDLEREHEEGEAAFYYEVRDKRFNRPATKSRTTTPGRAALFIYLNRTGFNGLYRVNSKGAFNVPIGRYASPRINDPEGITRLSVALNSRHVSLAVRRFSSALTTAAKGDFVYLDPPYAPLSQSAAFTAYSRQRFTLEDQQALQRLVIALARKGCHVLLSNSTAPEIVDLYQNSRPAQEVGLQTRRVPARRAINCHANRRGPVEELIVSNVWPKTDDKSSVIARA